jgi:hypothetical protein
MKGLVRHQKSNSGLVYTRNGIINDKRANRTSYFSLKRTRISILYELYAISVFGLVSLSGTRRLRFFDILLLFPVSASYCCISLNRRCHNLHFNDELLSLVCMAQCAYCICIMYPVQNRVQSTYLNCTAIALYLHTLHFTATLFRSLSFLNS